MSGWLASENKMQASCCILRRINLKTNGLTTSGSGRYAQHFINNKTECAFLSFNCHIKKSNIIIKRKLIIPSFAVSVRWYIIGLFWDPNNYIRKGRKKCVCVFSNFLDFSTQEVQLKLHCCPDFSLLTAV